MRILLVGNSFGFPNGSGAGARVRSYARGLIACGATPYVATMNLERPSRSGSSNQCQGGEWRGIEYEYTAGTTEAARSIFGRLLQEFPSALRLAKILLCHRESPSFDCAVLFGMSFRWFAVLRILTWLSGVPLVVERNEFPFVWCAAPSRIQRMHRAVFEFCVSRSCDGVIVISRFLEGYFAARLRPGSPILRVPILVSHDDFVTQGRKPNDVVLYVGSLSHDGEVESLMSAFAVVGNLHSSTELVVAGGGTSADLVRLRSSAGLLGLADRVRFVGQVGSDEIPSLIMSARVLALPRASGTFSTAGFPTKLGEYLASGRPVVVTATGDIPLYLTDCVDCFLVPPDDVRAFSAALQAALEDPDAVRIGEAGRATAIREFDPKVHMQRLIDMVAALSGRAAHEQNDCAT